MSPAFRSSRAERRMSTSTREESLKKSAPPRPKRPVSCHSEDASTRTMPATSSAYSPSNVRTIIPPLGLVADGVLDRGQFESRGVRWSVHARVPVVIRPRRGRGQEPNTRTLVSPQELAISRVLSIGSCPFCFSSEALNRLPRNDGRLWGSPTHHHRGGRDGAFAKACTNASYAGLGWRSASNGSGRRGARSPRGLSSSSHV
jgi:hypothetical protein